MVWARNGTEQFDSQVEAVSAQSNIKLNRLDQFVDFTLNGWMREVHVYRIPSFREARVRTEHAQHQGIFTQMFKRASGSFFVCRADEVNIKKIFPRLALQWA